MIAKITKGSSFGGCVRYVMNKKDAQLIGAKGVLLDDTRSIINSFEDQAKMNPRLGKMVGHISLNFSAQDREKVDNAFMLKVTGEYMQRMKIVDTLCIVVRHHDREHPHCHIVFSRVDNNGKTISDQNDRHRSVKACRALTDKYGLYVKATDAKQDVKRERLRGPDKIKYEIHDAIKAALPFCSNWKDLEKRLDKKGISVAYKYNGNTDQRQGVIFSKDGQSFNGSKVDRQFSYSKLDATLNANAQGLAQMSPIPSQRTTEQNSQDYTWPTESSYRQSQSAGSLLGSLLDIQPAPPEEPEDDLTKKRRKKKKPQIKFKP